MSKSLEVAYGIHYLQTVRHYHMLLLGWKLEIESRFGFLKSFKISYFQFEILNENTVKARMFSQVLVHIVLPGCIPFSVRDNI